MKKRLTCKYILPTLILACTASVLSVGTPSMAEDARQTDSAEATVMQMMKTEGDVRVSNSSGRDISLISNMKLYNGYHTETREASYAWINLDSEKLTKLDAVSEAEVRKKGKKLEILLESGNLFFNVKEDLKDDETLNVRTSTMVMGVRGTSGIVKSVDKWHTQIYILEGTVQCHVTDSVTGQMKDITVASGEYAEFYAYPQEQEGDKCDIITKKFTEDDIDGFALVELVQDVPLCEEIQEASDLDVLSLADVAQQRLEESEAGMRQTMSEIQAELEKQEHHISREAVWEDGQDNGNVSEGNRNAVPDDVRAAGRETNGHAGSSLAEKGENDAATDENRADSEAVSESSSSGSKEDNRDSSQKWENSGWGGKPGSPGSGSGSGGNTDTGNGSGDSPDHSGGSGSGDSTDPGNNSSSDDNADTNTGGSATDSETGNPDDSMTDPDTGNTGGPGTNPDTIPTINNTANYKADAPFNPTEFGLEGIDPNDSTERPGGSVTFTMAQVNDADIERLLYYYDEITLEPIVIEVTDENGAKAKVNYETLYISSHREFGHSDTGAGGDLKVLGNVEVKSGGYLMVSWISVTVEGNLVNNGEIQNFRDLAGFCVKGNVINNGNDFHYTTG